MATIYIARNPEHINDIYENRKASYVAGVASPASFYWRTLRGDKAAALRRGLSRKDAASLAGFRLVDGRVHAVCVLPGGYHYTVPL